VGCEAGGDERPSIGKSAVLQRCAVEAGTAAQTCFDHYSEAYGITGGMRGVEFTVVVWAKGCGRDEM
jgi:hypothetical protein